MGVTAGAASHFGAKMAIWSRGPEAAAAVRVRLSKIRYYLVDNVRSTRLSDLRRAVNDKIRCGNDASGGCAFDALVGLPASKVTWTVRNPPVRGYCVPASHPSAQNAEEWGTPPPFICDLELTWNGWATLRIFTSRVLLSASAGEAERQKEHCK
jgi:hypothetical protein